MFYVSPDVHSKSIAICVSDAGAYQPVGVARQPDGNPTGQRGNERHPQPVARRHPHV